MFFLMLFQGQGTSTVRPLSSLTHLFMDLDGVQSTITQGTSFSSVPLLLPLMNPFHPTIKYVIGSFRRDSIVPSSLDLVHSHSIRVLRSPSPEVRHPYRSRFGTPSSWKPHNVLSSPGYRPYSLRPSHRLLSRCTYVNILDSKANQFKRKKKRG